MNEQEQRERITCPVHKKRLARRDEGGLWLYCKLCKVEHHYTWQQLKQEVSQAQVPR